ncbi:MAG: YecA family protein [Ideonella sp. MAG2]|nr:MAG: YecA family protein [Ideonella sp. MAG2]
MIYPDYDANSPITPLEPAELDAIDNALSSLPQDGVMTLDGLDGYLTALVVGPAKVLGSLTTAQWLPLVWGGDPDEDSASPFASKRQRKNMVVAVLRHLRHLAAQFDAGAEDWQPIFSLAEHGEREWADACDWCAGFLQAVDLQPEAWGDVWDSDALGAALAPLLQLGGGLGEAGDEEGLDQEDLNDAQMVDTLSRLVPEAVVALRAHFHLG